MHHQRGVKPRRCGLKSPKESVLQGWGLKGQGWAITVDQEGKEQVSVTPQEQHGHRGWQRQWQSSDVPTEELIVLRRGKRASQGRTGMDGREPKKGECLASTSAPISARKITGKEKKPKQIPILLNIPGRKITQGKKQTKQKTNSPLAPRERQRHFIKCH